MENKRWTEDEINYLKAHYAPKSVKRIAKHLKRTENAVRWMAKELELTEQMTYWSREDTVFLAENYTTLSLEELSQRLGRSISAIRKKAALFNITKLAGKANTESIEKGVSFFKGKSGEFLQILTSMEVGDSFQYPTEERQTVQNCIIKFPDKVFRTRKVDEHTRRCWRLL